MFLPASLEPQPQILNPDELGYTQLPPGENGATSQPNQVHKLPNNVSTPSWLKLLLSLQQRSKLVFLIIFGLTLIAYGYTAYIQDRWKEQHGRLKRLREQERQQVIINESLKHELADAAEQPNSGLVNPDPSRIIFVPAAPPRPAKAANPQSSAWTLPRASHKSVGY
jgi:hypothetical protein